MDNIVKFYHYCPYYPYRLAIIVQIVLSNALLNY